MARREGMNQTLRGFRRGRTSNSPPQLGQMPAMPWVQDAQKVHSKLQIRASALSWPSGAWQRSHWGRISRGTAHPI
jgi:hypothetical protein